LPPLPKVPLKVHMRQLCLAFPGCFVPIISAIAGLSPVTKITWAVVGVNPFAQLVELSDKRVQLGVDIVFIKPAWYNVGGERV
jgi:hypothetical protein